MMFYKYRQINNYTLRQLIDKKLWKSYPTSFNDPFEFRLIQYNEDEIYKIKGLNNIKEKNANYAKLEDKDLVKTVIETLQCELNKMKVISLAFVGLVTNKDSSTIM